MAKPQQTRTKARAYRIDPSYIVRPSVWRSSRFWTTIGVCIAVVGWIAVSSFGFKRRGIDRWSQLALLHNPGHVTIHHAQFENDCAQCHASENGHFITHVSDQTCLKCHDGAIHHENQTTLIAQFKPKPSTQPAAEGAEAAAATPVMDNHPQGLISSNCVHCHVEHRGETALIGNGPGVCLECHANLANFDKAKPPLVQTAISSFSLKGHPRFGQHPAAGGMLASDNGQWRDQTKLKYNHAIHNGMDALKDNCVACHTPLSPPPNASAAATPGLPALIDKDRPLAANSQMPRGDMMPISFERNCAACHKLELVGGLAVPHRSLATIRGELSALPSLALSQVKVTADDLSDDPSDAKATSKKIFKLMSNVAKLNAASITEAATNADGEKDNGNDLNQKDYYRQKAAALKYLDWLASGGVDHKAADGTTAKSPVLTITTAPPLPAPGEEADSSAEGSARPATTQPLGSDRYEVPDPAISEIFLAYVGTSPTNACSTCHVMNGGDVPAGAQYKLSLATADTSTTAPSAAETVPNTSPTTQPALLDTVATGITSQPRRWFMHSHFEHAAHRDLSCYNCHASAWTSTDTADILSPDIDSKNLNLSEAERSKNNIRSCVDCHSRTDSAMSGTAPDDCTTCHVYHDRTKEDSLDARQRDLHRQQVMLEPAANRSAAQAGG